MKYRLGLAALLIGSVGLAEERSRWTPGEAQSRALPGEVKGPDVFGSASDGVYGRFDGDLDFGIGLGAELDDAEPRAALRASAHYFWMAGAQVGLSRGESEDAAGTRLSLGVDLRPLFVPRWSQNWSKGPALLDLTLDSVSLGLGVFWAEPQGGSFGDQRGFELQLGFGVPLMGHASGLWLEPRGLLRWPEGEDAEPAALLVLSWHQLVLSPWAR